MLWIETDVTTKTLKQGDYANLGNNQMLAADPATGEVRRFLTGPNGCEITGITETPDGRTMFVNIQHPGEAARRARRPRQTECGVELAGRRAPALGDDRDSEGRRRGDRDVIIDGADYFRDSARISSTASVTVRRPSCRSD